MSSCRGPGSSSVGPCGDRHWNCCSVVQGQDRNQLSLPLGPGSPPEPDHLHHTALHQGLHRGQRSWAPRAPGDGGGGLDTGRWTGRLWGSQGTAHRLRGRPAAAHASAGCMGPAPSHSCSHTRLQLLHTCVLPTRPSQSPAPRPRPSLPTPSLPQQPCTHLTQHAKHTCTHACIHVYTCMQIHKCAHTCTHLTRVLAHRPICTACMHTRMCTRTQCTPYAHKDLCTLTCTHTPTSTPYVHTRARCNVAPRRTHVHTHTAHIDVHTSTRTRAGTLLTHSTVVPEARALAPRPCLAGSVQRPCAHASPG